MAIIGVFSIKGGVGKTATAVNLAYLASQGKGRSLLWDLDPQAASSFYFLVEGVLDGGVKGLVSRAIRVQDRIRPTGYEHLDIIHSDASYRKLDIILRSLKKPKRALGRVLRDLRPEYRHIVLDCPPGLSLVSENVLRAADLVLVPVIPTPLSLRTLAQLRDFCEAKEIDVPLVPFFSMVDRRKHLHLEVIEQEAARGFIQSAIPYSSDVEQMCIRRAPLVAYGSWTPAAKAYEDLWREVKHRL